MSRPSSTGASQVWLSTPDAAGRLDPSRLATEDRAQWAALHSRRRRLDWASSRVLLDAVPMAPDRNRSLSHSHGYAALALAPPFLAIGVDVEWLVPRDFLGMAEIAFAPVEVDCLASIGDPADRCAKFYELWTLKEAFAKALGLPLVDALQQCCFADAGRTGTIVVPTPQSWCAKVFAPRPQLRVAVACVADVTGSIRFPLETLEWPPARPTAWPIACSLASIGGGRGGAC